MKSYKLLVLLLLNPLIVGCGQPGPLYLPGQAAPIHVEPEPVAKPDPQSDKNK
ncbi:LPS translocon maturation chaperone LptM [Candidatus Methylobacter oryzae]|uniref:Lipoprotein n=1 Tax=Candidatus Methylobacter oryzae TaxID=2497749 RepID=A0ABY3C9Q3_9GAMM|nr:lipoprotein [Candidatus Methylobacter oryzae]